MKNDKNFEELAPGIHFKNFKVLENGFTKMLNFVEEKKITWSNKNSDNSGPEYITFYENDINEKKEIYNFFDENFKKIEEEYLSEFNTEMSKASFYKREYIWAMKYTVSGGTRGLHFDDQDPEKFRRVTILYYANDEYSGGEIEFPRFNVKFSPKKNDILIFPSSYVYSHKVLPLNSGVRYAIGSLLI